LNLKPLKEPVFLNLKPLKESLFLNLKPLKESLFLNLKLLKESLFLNLKPLKNQTNFLDQIIIALRIKFTTFINNLKVFNRTKNQSLKLNINPKMIHQNNFSQQNYQITSSGFISFCLEFILKLRFF